MLALLFPIAGLIEGLVTPRDLSVVMPISA
jgi:hypothetical protein